MLACFTGLLVVNSIAQERKIDLYEPGERAQSFYVEAFGPGFFSVNYDFRFQKTRNSWGMRGGVGAVSFDGEIILTLPVQVNYLFGKDGKYFEVGGGASYVERINRNDYGTYDPNGNLVVPHGARESRSEIMGSLTFGYRKQPLDGGFTFRTGLSPIIYDREFIPYLPYISFGYSF